MLCLLCERIDFSHTRYTRVKPKTGRAWPGRGIAIIITAVDFDQFFYSTGTSLFSNDLLLWMIVIWHPEHHFHFQSILRQYNVILHIRHSGHTRVCLPATSGYSTLMYENVGESTTTSQLAQCAIVRFIPACS